MSESATKASAKKSIDVVAAVFWDGRSFLAVQRPPGADMAGYWEFPGGKIEPGESREAALVRELQEELDVTATEFEFWCELCHEYDHLSVRLHFFHVRSWVGTLRGLDGQELFWAHPHGCDADADCAFDVLEFLPADTALVDELRRMQTM